MAELEHKDTQPTRNAATRTAQAAQTVTERTGAAARTTVEAGIEAGDETMRHGLRASHETTQHIADQTAEQVGNIANRVAEASERNAENLRALLGLGHVAQTGLRELRHTMTGVMSRTVSPAVFIELQQRFVHDYVEALLQGGAEMLRVSRRLTEEALRPLEQRLKQNGDHQQNHGKEHRGKEHRGKVADIMTNQVELTSPNQTIQDAARLMASADTGVLPVTENERLIGMITDRDIALRVTAEGKDPNQTKVREIMTPDTKYCFEDEELGPVAENMAQLHVRRLPVVSREKRLVGIVDLTTVTQNQRDARQPAANGAR